MQIGAFNRKDRSLVARLAGPCSSPSRAGARREFDFYPTPHSMVDELVCRLGWDRSVPIWEPCLGDGRMKRALEHRGYTVVGSDIATGQDFFDFNTSSKPAIAICTNPPFKYIRPFIRHAFQIGIERMALVCNERLWACKAGSAQFREHQPSRFVNLSWREDYLGRGPGHSPDRSLAISIWDGTAGDCVFQIWDRSDQSDLFQ